MLGEEGARGAPRRLELADDATLARVKHDVEALASGFPLYPSYVPAA